MKKQIFHNISIAAKQNKKLLSVLIDPDKQNFSELLNIIKKCNQNSVDIIMVGGSIIEKGNLNSTVHFIKENSKIPVLLFPGNHTQLSAKADGILFMSLISGTNPEFLIENQTKATPELKKMKLEVIPMGYVLVNTGNETTAIRVSNTEPINYLENEKAANVALTGEYLGLKMIYIDGGSGAAKPISSEMINATINEITVPLIIGGGIRSKEEAERIYTSGADMIVIGNGVENNRNLIDEISSVKKELNLLSI